MPFFKLDALPKEKLAMSYATGSGSYITGQQIEIARFTFPAGTGANAHSHPNEQITIVIAGRARLRIGDEEREVGPGDAWHVPAGVEHQLQVIDEFTVISCKNLVDGKGHKSE